VGTIIGSIITGAIIGALTRVFMPGRQNISIIWTIILGAVGAFVGTWVAGFFGVAHTAGIDWIRWAAAMLAISVYLGVTGRK
jgi:predicted membrane protein